MSCSRWRLWQREGISGVRALKAGSHLLQCSFREVCISFPRDVLQSLTASGPVLALMSNTCLPAIVCPTRRLLQPGRGQTTVTWVGPLYAILWGPAVCSYQFSVLGSSLFGSVPLCLMWTLGCWLPDLSFAQVQIYFPPPSLGPWKSCFDLDPTIAFSLLVLSSAWLPPLSLFG